MQSTLVVSEVQNYDPQITLGSVLWLSFALYYAHSLEIISQISQLASSVFLSQKTRQQYFQPVRSAKTNRLASAPDDLCGTVAQLAYHFLALLLSSLQALTIHDRWPHAPHAVAESYILAEGKQTQNENNKLGS
jgi:hypothetical protein